jgi:hypothetical protein
MPIISCGTPSGRSPLPYSGKVQTPLGNEEEMSSKVDHGVEL